VELRSPVLDVACYDNRFESTQNTPQDKLTSPIRNGSAPKSLRQMAENAHVRAIYQGGISCKKSGGLANAHFKKKALL